MSKRQNSGDDNYDLAAKQPRKDSDFVNSVDFDDDDRRNEEEERLKELSGDEPTQTVEQVDTKHKSFSNVLVYRQPLSLEDISKIYHSFIFKREVIRPKWFDTGKMKSPRQMVLLRVDCSCSPEDLSKVEMVEKFFNDLRIPMRSSAIFSDTYWDHLLYVPALKKKSLNETVEDKTDPSLESSEKKSFKLSLMTTIEDMADRRYPLHGSEWDKIDGLLPVIPTREYYTHVTEDSPIFVVDCEMCVTDIDVSELTRVTLIDENGNSLLDTFVKPANKIVDYVTRFSGITKELLENVSIRLQDVQKAFRCLLPPDAILCGHSIENDLKALRMSHPYCIDVSLIYNMNTLKRRTSLRNLMNLFFNEQIQSSVAGHCSYEDAWSTLRLLKLKLANGEKFGRLIDGFDYTEWVGRQNFNQLFKVFPSSSFNDFANETSCNKVRTRLPRVIGQCLTCHAVIQSSCYTENCPCVKKAAQYCCLCVARDFKTEEPPAGDFFNFGRAIAALTKLWYRPSLQELLQTYKVPAKIMIGRRLLPEQKAEDLSDKNVHFYDTTNLTTLDDISAELFDEKLLSHDLCLLEENMHNWASEQIDAYLRAIHQRISVNSIFGVLFCFQNSGFMCINSKVE